MADKEYSKIHFIWDPNKQDVCDFAKTMTDAFGQASKDDSDLIVAIGGDGTALWALDHSDGIPVFAMTMPNIKSSEGFLTCHEVVGPENLMDIVNQSTAYDLPVLEGTVTFADGTSHTHYTCADIVIEKLKINGGATLDLKAEFNDKAIVDVPGIGSNGLVITTPLSSTGYHVSNGGTPFSIKENLFALSAIVPYKPRPFAECVFEPGTKITITPPPRTYDKRPLGVGFGSGIAYTAPEVGSAIKELTVTTSDTQKATLLMRRAPEQNVLAALNPQ